MPEKLSLGPAPSHRVLLGLLDGMPESRSKSRTGPTGAVAAAGDLFVPPSPHSPQPLLLPPTAVTTILASNSKAATARATIGPPPPPPAATTTNYCDDDDDYYC